MATPTVINSKKVPLLALCLLLGALVSTPAWAVSGSNSTTGFVDNSSLTRDITFVPGDFPGGNDTITNICVAVNFAKSDDNAFVPEGGPYGGGTPFHNEIELVLTSPGGTNVTLISNDGDTEINADPFESFNSGSVFFDGTITFDESAPLPVNNDPDQPVAGVFSSDPGSLNSFLSEGGAGTWTLFVEDDVGSDGLSFYSYTLFINEACGASPQFFGSSEPVPTLGEWALYLLTLSLGLLGCAAIYRRRLL